MIARLGQFGFELLIALDQLAHVLIGGILFVLFGGACPSADETISSRVGRGAMAGERWALILEVPIDGFFVAIGHPPRHCRNSIEPGCPVD